MVSKRSTSSLVPSSPCSVCVIISHHITTGLVVAARKAAAIKSFMLDGQQAGVANIYIVCVCVCVCEDLGNK